MSLPFSHPSLKEIVKFKEDKKERVQKYMMREKQNLLNMDKKSLLKNRRISLVRNIYQLRPEYYLRSQKRNAGNNE